PGQELGRRFSADDLGGVFVVRRATYTDRATAAIAIPHTTHGCRADAGSAGTIAPATAPATSRPTSAPPRICFIPRSSSKERRTFQVLEPVPLDANHPDAAAGIRDELVVVPLTRALTVLEVAVCLVDALSVAGPAVFGPGRRILRQERDLPQAGRRTPARQPPGDAVRSARIAVERVHDGRADQHAVRRRRGFVRRLERRSQLAIPPDGARSGQDGARAVEVVLAGRAGAQGRQGRQGRRSSVAAHRRAG